MLSKRQEEARRGKKKREEQGSESWRNDEMGLSFMKRKTSFFFQMTELKSFV